MAYYADPYLEDYEYDEGYYDVEWREDRSAGVDFSIWIGVAAVLFAMFVIARGRPATTWGDGIASGIEAAVEPNALAAPEIQFSGGSEPAVPPDPYAFAAPYTDYVITQGVHGASYGQMAIDLAAGKGALILSPINGVIADKYVDQYGNPTLIIENDVYVVKLLHGNYTAEIGESVSVGDQVGTESNRGYTTDMNGVPCAGRTDYCGYHTHLNVYDKTLESNVNPLNLIGP